MKRLFILVLLLTVTTNTAIATTNKKGIPMKKITQTAGRTQLGDFAPDFAHYNDDILFGENWNNQDIDLKTRSIITMTALISQGITDSSLKYHLQNSKNNGVTKEEVAAIITNTAFYAGWPKAWAAFNLAKEVWNEEIPVSSDKDKYEQATMFPIGAPNDAYAKYFKGQSYLNILTKDQVVTANVTFEPKCRNNWHIHHKGGQILLVTGGRGYYQEWGKPAQELHAGDVVNIPPEIKHWHGAAKDSWFSHIAIEVPSTGGSNEWLEEVSDEEYDKLK